MTMNSYFRINPNYVIIKLHYFFMGGGFAGSLPYAVLLGKGLNIHASAMGVSLTGFKLVMFVTSPIIGSLVDYFQNIKVFLVCLLAAVMAGGPCLLYIPPIRGDCSYNTTELSNSPKINISLLLQADRQCLGTFNGNCTSLSELRNSTEDNSLKHKLFRRAHANNSTYVVPKDNSDIKGNVTSQNISISYDNVTIDILVGDRNVSSDCDSYMHVFTSYQFWLFTLIVVIGGASFETAYSLSDVACYNILGSERHLYGSQRLFLTIGWALICALGGYLNEILSEERKDYSPGIYLMVALVAVDMLIVSKMPKIEGKCSKDISGDVKKIFGSCEIVFFAFGTVLMGIFYSTATNYEFWYLQDLGAGQTLIGAALFIQSSSEIPLFLVSSWIIERFGSFNCLAISFTAYSIRFGSYYLLHNPWWALAIDTTHGIAFALFWSNLTNFSSLKALKGTEATMLGILIGLNTGLGSCLGNLLGGMIMDKYGGHMLFCSLSVFSAACAISFATFPRCIRKRGSPLPTHENISLHQIDTSINKK